MEACKYRPYYRVYWLYGCIFIANLSVLKAKKLNIIIIASKCKKVQDSHEQGLARGFFTLLFLLIISIGVRICDFAQIWIFALAV